MAQYTWKVWGLKFFLTLIVSLAVLAAPMYFLFDFLGNKFILNKKIARPVIEEYDATLDDCMALRKSATEEMEKAEGGKPDLLKEVEANLEDAESWLLAANDVLSEAINKNSEKHFQLTMQMIAEVKSYLSAAKNKLEEYKKSVH